MEYNFYLSSFITLQLKNTEGFKMYTSKQIYYILLFIVLQLLLFQTMHNFKI